MIHHINKLKDENHNAISIDAEKAFDKTQHILMIKIKKKRGLERTYLKIVKAIYDKPTVNIILNGEKLKSFPSRNKTKVSTLTAIIQHSFGSPSYSNQRRRKKKGIQIRREVKLSLFADGIHCT